MSNLKPFNVDCPICFEQSGEFVVLSCMHKFHNECLEGHIDEYCPVCRQHIEEWPSGLKNKIEKNSLEFQSELDEEDRQNIIDFESRRNDNVVGNRLLPTYRLEMLAAFQYFKEEGIPRAYIPSSVHISYNPDHPRLEPGIVFSSTIDCIKKIIQNGINSSNLLSDSDDSDDEMQDIDLKAVKFV